ncbi:MAG TPA: hypothetical protein VF178_08305 [Gemmatimonadaceae bacterium]
MAQFQDLWRTRLDVELNSVSTVLFTSTRRQQAINDAQAEFADLTECLIRQSSVTCSCNVTEYQLLSSGVLGGSTDYIRLATQGVEYLHTDSNGRLTQAAGDDFVERPIHWRNKHDASWRESTTPTQTPTGYYLRPDGGNLYIGLSEPPDVGSSEAAEIRVPYVAMPAPMSSSDAEPFTVNSSVRTDLRIYHQALPHFAAYRLLPLQGKVQEAQAQLQIFLSYVTRYQQAQRPKGGQRVSFQRDYFSQARSGADGTGRTVPGWTWRS